MGIVESLLRLGHLSVQIAIPIRPVIPLILIPDATLSKNTREPITGVQYCPVSTEGSRKKRSSVLTLLETKLIRDKLQETWLTPNEIYR